MHNRVKFILKYLNTIKHTHKEHQLGQEGSPRERSVIFFQHGFPIHEILPKSFGVYFSKDQEFWPQK